MQQERRPPGRLVKPERQRAYGQVRGAAAQVAWVRDQGAQAGRATAEPDGRVFVRGRFTGVDAVEVAAAGEGQPGRSRGELRLGQPVGGAVLEHRRSRQLPQRVGVAQVAGPVGPFGQQRGRAVAEAGAGRLERGELQVHFLQRDGLGGPPAGGGEQRGPGDPGAGRIILGRVDRQRVAMLLQVCPHPQPVRLTPRRHRPSRRDRSDASIPSGSNSARSFLNSASLGYISASTSGGTRESLAR